MSTRLRSIAAAAALAGLALLLYSTRLDDPPLSADEQAVLQQAQSAGTMPLFFHAGVEHWLQPLPVYATALVAAIKPGPAAGRRAAALTGAVNIVLMLVLMQRLFPDLRIAVPGALLLLLTPAHFVYSRTGVDTIFVVPFVLAWLIALATFLEQGGPRWIAAGAFALGLGAYTQPSAPLTMGFLLVVTLAVLWGAGHRSPRLWGAALGAFALPLSVAAIWFAAHPQAYLDTYGRWVIPAAHLRSPVDGVTAFVNWNTLSTRVSLYWGFFDPSWLFLNGPAATGGPLGGTAPFLAATSVLVGLWLYRRFEAAGAGAWAALLGGGLAVAPLAASTFGQPHAIGDAFAAVPFVVVMAGSGLAALMRQQAGIWRALLWMTLVALALDWARFYTSYFSA